MSEINPVNICIGVTDNCVNPDSYGEICVKCNQCGRFNKEDNIPKMYYPQVDGITPTVINEDKER